MNSGICDPATDRHSSAKDSIKLQIKAGTSKGRKEAAWRCDREKGKKMSEGRIKGGKKKPHLRNPRT